MAEKKVKDLLRKYLEGRATPDEEKLIDEWYGGLPSEPSDILRNEDKEDLRKQYWEKLRSAIDEEAAKTRVIWPKVLLIAASVAAIVMVAIGALPPELKNPISRVATWSDKELIENTSGQAVMVHLPDSSQVELFPHSSLTYDRDFNESDRRVALTGEAFFIVSRDEQRPFFVFTRDVVTRVLGTSFNVSAYRDADRVTVSVKTGKVSVYAHNQESEEQAENESVVLTPNQQAVFTRADQKVSRTLVKAPQPVKSKDAAVKIRFEASPVSEVFEALEKMYHIDIEFDKEAFTGCTIPIENCRTGNHAGDQAKLFTGARFDTGRCSAAAD